MDINGVSYVKSIEVGKIFPGPAIELLNENEHFQLINQ